MANALTLGHRTRKGVTGYDVTSLVVGSEGTLAVVSEVTLEIAAKTPGYAGIIGSILTILDAAKAVGNVTTSGVLSRCIELFDATTLAAMREAGNSIERARRSDVVD